MSKVEELQQGFLFCAGGQNLADGFLLDVFSTGNPPNLTFESGGGWKEKTGKNRKQMKKGMK